MKLPLVQRVRTQLRQTVLRDWVVAYRYLGVTDQDLFFASYPKSGSTWLTFMLSDLIWDDGQQQEITDSRFMPTVGKQHLGERRLPSGGRVIRTHERYRPCCKRAIYMVRDGRDVAVSAYFQIKRVMGLESDFSEFLKHYLEGRFIGAGLWHEHVTSWLDSPCFKAGHGLVVRYEDLKSDVCQALRRCAEFLKIDVTSEKLGKAANVGSFDQMQKTEKRTELISHRERGPAISFVRKGVVGDWQNYFSGHDLEAFYAVARSAMERLGYADELATAPG